MGLDQHLVMAHNIREAQSDDFWRNAPDVAGMDDFEYDKPAILWYNRKNWDLHTPMSSHYNLENGEFVELDQNGLEYMLDILTHNPDYFDGFNSVPALCKVIYNYDKIRQNGFTIFYEGDF